jgi:hypothetical protein
MRLRPRSDIVTPPLPETSARLASVSAATAAGFVLLLAALHGIEPEFDPSWRFISEYELGGWGGLMSLAFLCLAVSAGSLLLAVRSQLRTAGGRVGVWVLGVSAFAFLLAGTFRTDSQLAETGTASGVIHSIAAALGGFVPLAAYLIAWSLARNVAWRELRPALWWVTVPAIIGNLASFAQQAAFASGGGTLGPATPVGWPNRVLVLAFAVWMLAAALLVRSKAQHARLELAVAHD